MPTLRPATPSDIPAIIAISQSAYWSNFRELEPDAWDHPGYRDLVRDMHGAEARDFWPDIMLAEIGGVPGGWGARFRGRNEISEMWVHADFQGKGLGTALLQGFLKDIAGEGHPEAWIETHRRNAGAIRLYQRVGFVPDHEVSRLSKGLGRDIPLIRLRRTLP